jgi:phosphatidylglycerol:prolipoprotein diacylglycerol transferase
VLDVSLWILVASLVGARALFVLTHLESFRAPAGSWLDAFVPFRADGRIGVYGLSMWGGVLLATGAAFGSFARQRLPALAFADVLAPSVLLGEGITRIGCFLNGCCHGIPSAGPFGVRFPDGSLPALRFGDAALHPTQLYASALAFAGCALLLRFAARRPPDGSVFAAAALWLAGARIALDFARYRDAGEILWQPLGVALGASQLLCALVALASALALARLARAPQRLLAGAPSA